MVTVVVDMILVTGGAPDPCTGTGSRFSEVMDQSIELNAVVFLPIQR